MDWPDAGGASRKADAVASDFEAWDLRWTESRPCPRSLWYVPWGRAPDGMLVLTTEFGPVSSMWSRETSASHGASTTLLFTHHRVDGSCCELARLGMDDSGQAWHMAAGRRLPWRRAPEDDWGDFGLVYLVTLVLSRQQDLGLDSAVGHPILCYLLDMGNPATALLR